MIEQLLAAANEIGDREQTEHEHDLAVVMRDALATLTWDQRQVLEMHFRQGMRVCEIARATGRARCTVSNHKQKALRRIREVFRGYEPTSDT